MTSGTNSEKGRFFSSIHDGTETKIVVQNCDSCDSLDMQMRLTDDKDNKAAPGFSANGFTNPSSTVSG